MIPDTELAWLAGIFDGEGSARIYRSNQRGKGGALTYFAQVQAISNTDPEMIERVGIDLQLLGLNSRYHKRRDNGNPKRKDAKIWWKACGSIVISGYESVVLYLEAILPYTTGLKKAQALHVLSFVRLRQSRGKKNWGKGKPKEMCRKDEEMYQSQPSGRGIAPTIQ